MSNSIKDKVVDAGKSVADAAKSVGQRVATGAEDAANWVKDKTGMGQSNPSGKIAERMEVIASCGKKMGVVDHLEGEAIKLTKNDSADGQHHFIPVGWVDHVDSHVHLKKNSVETENGWKTNAADCGCAG